MSDTAARLLRMLGLLRARSWSGAALADELDVSTRTVRADVGRLRALGYDVDATSGTRGGYRLRADATLPPLVLDEPEAVAVAVALRTVGSSGVAGGAEVLAGAEAKLDRLLPSTVRQRLQTLGAVVETVPRRGDVVEPDVLDAVAAACGRSEQLRFDYASHHHQSGRHRAPSRRRVEPYRLVHVAGRWYLAAYDLDRDDWRSFRVDRMTPRVPTGPRFDPRPPPEPDLETFVTQGRMAALWAVRARVLVHADAGTVAARIPIGSWMVQPRDRDTSLLDAGAQTVELLAVYLGALGLDITVDGDTEPELHRAAGELAERYRRAVTP